MTDYLDITDTLIMLLSSDWFLPFWNEIGIDFADGSKTAIQEGCRAIVRRFMEDSGSYLHIDFREERWQETNSAFIELLDSFGAAKLIAALDWCGSPPDDLSTGIMLWALTDDALMSGGKGTTPALNDAIRFQIADLSVSSAVDPDKFDEISLQSNSTWDRYLAVLFEETPDALATKACFAVKQRRLRSLWNRIRKRLSEQQKGELLSWYRAMAKARDIPVGVIPSYIH
ncbi:MAG TPA: hypothetical protein VK578_12655 [Edaphobacter sp.]|nr:hypothetical protein [Edaphobacter sp.]